MQKMIRWMIVFLVPINMYAHVLLMKVVDNKDDTLTVIGKFSTGEGASGVLLKLRDIESKKIIYQKRLPDESQLTVSIPKEPYEIILDGGTHEKVTKVGIAPSGGFEKKADTHNAKQEALSESQPTNQATSTLLALAFLLLGATIGVSIYNTQRLLKGVHTIDS